VIKREVDLLARDLIRLLGMMTELHGELAMHMRNKLAAIKQADSDRIQSITAREMVLADQAAEREGLRRQITARILEGLGQDTQAGRSISVTDLAEFFTEPRRSQLLVAAAGLREKLHEINRMRVTTSLITQEMLKHLGAVLNVMRSGPGQSDFYSRSGRREQSGPASVFEAVG